MIKDAQVKELHKQFERMKRERNFYFERYEGAVKYAQSQTLLYQRIKELTLIQVIKKWIVSRRID